MPISRSALVSFSILSLLAGCDNRHPPAPTEASPTPDIAGVERDVAGIKAQVGLDQATKRIEELERDVAYLKTTPTTIDLKLLTDRVQALEVKLAERDDTQPSPPTERRSLSSAQKSGPPPHVPRAALVLPDLERR